MDALEPLDGKGEEVARFFDACLVELASNPGNAAERLLDVCCEVLAAHSGRLLTLAPETGQLEVLAERSQPVGNASQMPPFKSISALKYLELDQDLAVGSSILKRLPAARTGVVVGSIELMLDRAREIPVPLYEAFARLLPLVRANAALRSGLRVLPPIPDISGDELSFSRRVYDYLDAHTRASLVAVFLVSESLEVSLVYGPEGEDSASFLGADQVLHTVAEARLDPGEIVSLDRGVLSRVPQNPGIWSTVAISTVVDSLESETDAIQDDSYVLLVGFPLEYQPSAAELAVFEHSLALAGYLHKIYAHLHRLVADTGEVAEIGSAITGLETSQMVRHHAKTQIDLAQNLVLELQKESNVSREKLETLSRAVNEVALDLERIKEATKAPSRDLKPTSLKDMWDTACSQVRWRLVRRKIAIRYNGPDVKVIAAPDWFRQVFLNLLLNSADAYDTADRRSGKITLNLHPLGPKSDRVTMTYSDDAIGVHPQHFLSCDIAEDVDINERIFRPGVTSKSGGSGWGLYVCRNIVSRTPGASITFNGGRSGVAFDITMTISHEGGS